MLNRSARGQTMVEMALVAPLFVMVLVGIIAIGIGVFYQQELTNVAREAARYAAIHSATAQCPTVSNLDPDPAPQTYFRCDTPQQRWPQMTAFAQERAFGLPPGGIQLSACWSGYWVTDGAGNFSDYDALPTDQSTGAPNPFRYCTIPSNDGAGVSNLDPRTQADQIACTSPMPLTTATNDMASAISASYGETANQVTVFACFNWAPPAAGFLLVPEIVTLRAVITETLQYQQ
ncbi:MAG TPA: TadE family protein [Candidatus Limnocylindria bacterium]|nr:TadE family protein [Candidatus Limnocylindria bacterium]